MRFAGYAAIFDKVDRGGDIIRKGAFAKTIRTGVPLLRQHDVRRPIGTIEHLSEDERGLRVIASLGRGQAVREGEGLSFGYRIRDGVNGTYRELIDLELIEISLVETPMQPLAQVLRIETDPNEGVNDGL
jgi:uncharacterized protein